MPTLRFTAHFPIQKRKSSLSPVGMASEYYHVASGTLHVAVDVPADESYAVAQAEAEVSAELYAWLVSCTVSVKSYPAELAGIVSMAAALR